MSRRARIEDILDLSVPSHPVLSADGRRIAYVVRSLDADADRTVDELWLVDTDGGAPRRLTRGPADAAPAWSPDGSRLAFLQDGQLAVLDLRGGEPEQVTELPLGAGAPSWSPDGRRIAFTAPVDPAEGTQGPMVFDGLDYLTDGAGLHGSIRRQVHVLDLDTDELRQVTDGPHSAGAPAWSPDGSTLAFTCGVGADHDLRHRTPVHLLAVAETASRVLAFAEGMATTVDWVADGSALLVTGWIGDPVGHARLYRVGVEGAELTDLSGDLDRNVMPGAPAYPGGAPQDHDGRVWFCVRDQGCTHLWSVAADGTDARPVVAGEGRVVSGLSIGGGRAAIVLATPTSYGEVAIVDLTTGAENVLSDHGAALSDVDLYVREERWFTIADGTRVQAWLLRDPAHAGPRPVLLDVHGGPHNAWNGAADEVHLYHQELVARGWTVLLVNPRGSDGYGEAFYTAARGRWGVADAADFLEPLDELVAEGTADPDRLAVAGYSYGGFMTCWLTGHDDRFAAAVAGGAVSDLVSMAGTSDHRRFLSIGELEGTHWETDYAALSPLTRVAEVRTPTLVLHGAADVRCPLGQAQQWHTALRERGVPTRLVVYPDASHLFVRLGPPSQRLDFNHRVRDWVEQHVTRARIDAAHWQRRLDQLAERNKVPGAQLGILRIGAGSGLITAPDELVELAHGVLHVGTRTSVTTDALFQIGSITKVWTTTLAMMLVDEGLLDLDTPVVEVLPELVLADPDVTKAVTIRHLVTHTSGIDGDVFTDTGRGDDCVERYVEKLGEAGQNHPVGATFSYCNSGFTLLGRVIEKVTGKGWDEVLRERLVTPLGLEHTATLPEEVLLHAAAVGHDESDGAMVPTKTWMLPRSVGPAGLIASTVADVLAFARLHLTGGVTADGTRILSAAGAAAMAAHEIDLPDGPVFGESWGLGWGRFSWDGHELIGHNGGTLGQSAYLRLLPEQGLAVALLTNSGSALGLYEDLYRELFAEVAGIAMTPRFAPPTEPVSVDVTPYLGVYERTGLRIEVTTGPDGAVLRSTLTGALGELVADTVEEYLMVPLGPGSFAIRLRAADIWVPVTFYEVADGAPYVHMSLRATPKVSTP